MSTQNQIKKKDLNKMFWRSQFIQFSHNYERMQSLSTLFALTPILRRLYKDKSKEERVKAQRRHLEFFNSHPYLPLSNQKMERQTHCRDNSIDYCAISGSFHDGHISLMADSLATASLT